MVLQGANSFVVFLLVLSGLVFVHELGHFLAARLVGVHVEEFGLGFPPRLVGVARNAQNRWQILWGPRTPPEFGGPRPPAGAVAAPGAPVEIGPVNAPTAAPAPLKRPGTIYSLNWIPIGGFVRPAGEDNAQVSGGLANASKTARVVVLAAGAGFNLIFAFLVFVVGFRTGWPDRVKIVGVAESSPAQAAGLQIGDVILTAAGHEIHYSQHLIDQTYSRLGQPIELTIDRAGQAQTLSLTPRTQWPEGQGPIGVELGQALITNYTWGQSFVRAGQEIGEQMQYLIHLPGRLLSKQIPLEAARPCGPVCINDLTREAVQMAQTTNAWFPIIQLLGLISVALAVSNLLPLPALDGGRILFVLIEAVRGRRLDPNREGLIHFVGLAMLLALMAVITYQDVFNPIIPR